MFNYVTEIAVASARPSLPTMSPVAFRSSLPAASAVAAWPSSQAASAIAARPSLQAAAVTTQPETQTAAEAVEQTLVQLKPDMIMDNMRKLLPGLTSFGIRLLVAVIILVVGIRCVKLLRKFTGKMFSRMGLDASVSGFLMAVIDAIAYAVVVLIAAEKIGVPSASIIALLGSATLAVGLSLQGSLANLAGSILIMVTRPYGVGDYIISGGIEGTVQSIGLVYTTLCTPDNKRITVPNGNISNSVVTNVTSQETRRVDVEVEIGYSSDVRLAKELMRQIYENHPLIRKEEGVTVYVGELGQNGVLIGARGWTLTPDYWTARWDILENVKEQFDDHGIEIPFTQVDVRVRSTDG